MMLKRKRIGKSSISFMLTMSIILTILMASSLSVFISYLNAKENAKEDLNKDIIRNINEITDIINVPLWSYDIETIEDIGKLYTRNDVVVKLKIIDSLGKTLFEAEKKDIRGTILKRVKEVAHGGDIAGKVELAISSAKYEKNIKQLVLSGSFTIVINLLLLVGLTGFFLRHFLNKPLNKLSEIVGLYAKGEYSQKEFDMPYVEFANVVEVINNMGTKITDQIDDIKVANKRYQDIFENAVEGIFQINLEGHFIDINPAFADIFGYNSPQELLKENRSKEFFMSDGLFFEIMNKLDDDRTINMEEFKGYKRNGETIWLQASARVVRDNIGALLYYEGSLKDISAQKEKEDAMRKKKEAEASSMAKTMFIANISHEIRTPLNSVLAMSDLLKGTECSENQKEYIDILKSSGEFLRVMIDDILDLSKIEANQLILEEIQFDINELLDDVVNIVSPRSRNINVEKHVEKDINHILVGDSLRIKQILINLMGNAVKFTGKGSVKLEVYPGEIEDNKIDIEFKVVDTGIGIEQSKLDVIFDSFSQAETFTNRQFGGTGLGLAISRKLVEMMGGELRVLSKIDQGSVFYFTISLKIDDTLREKSILEIPDDLFLKDLRILLADDIEPNRTVIKKYLEEYPLDIVEAENGKRACDIFFRDNFDLVLMDVEMPVMNGYDAIKKIRAWEGENSKETTPIIVISAHAFGEQKQKCFDSGCDYLLVKPIKKKDLIQSMYEAFNKRKNPECEYIEDRYEENRGKRSGKVYIDKVFEDLMPEFFTYFHETLSVMEKAYAEKNYEDLVRLGHGLKGSSRNYEIEELGEIFLGIEEAAKQKVDSEIEIMMTEAKEFIKNIKIEFIDRD